MIRFPSDALDRYALGGPKPVSVTTLPTDPEKLKRAIGEAIVKVVEDSYAAHPMRHRTSDEDLRRATICTDWFNRLVNQHRWTADRALSSMRYVLDDELSGRVHPLCTKNKQSKHIMFGVDRTLVH